MWLSNRLVITKTLTVILLYSTAVYLRKSMLSIDVEILRSLVQGIKFPDYQGQVNLGLLNMGEINYNISEIGLSKITMEGSEINASSLRYFARRGPKYLNISLGNGNLSFRANWAYSMWTSFEDQGELTFDINKAHLTFAVKIYTDARGLVNVTITHCAMRISSVDIDFIHASNLMYDSLKSRLKTRAEKSLPGGLCKGLRNEGAKKVTEILQNGQLKFVSFLPGEPLRYQNIISCLGWIFVSLFPTSMDIVHEFGVTLLVVLVLVSLYLVYEVIRSAQIIRRLVSMVGRPKSGIRTLDTENSGISYKDSRVSTTSVTLSSEAETTKKYNSFVSSFEKILWWRKTKES